MHLVERAADAAVHLRNEVRCATREDGARIVKKARRN
jgi:hypothetical protein